MPPAGSGSSGEEGAGAGQAARVPGKENAQPPAVMAPIRGSKPSVAALPRPRDTGKAPAALYKAPLIEELEPKGVEETPEGDADGEGEGEGVEGMSGAGHQGKDEAIREAEELLSKLDMLNSGAGLGSSAQAYSLDELD